MFVPLGVVKATKSTQKIEVYYFIVDHNKQLCNIVISSVGEGCSADPEPGLCKRYCPRYYFDPTEYKCKQFIYGCCGGNSNNYLTQQACLNVCNDGRFILPVNELRLAIVNVIYLASGNILQLATTDLLYYAYENIQLV